MAGEAEGTKRRGPRRPFRGRARTPTVLQMTGVECGVACLAMVLGYHGRWESIDALRVAAGVTRDGSKASNLLKAARRFGLSAKGFKKEPKTLTDLPVPSIIHWNFNHYVVFEGIRRGYAYINDPASGPRRLPLNEFGEYYTGVVLAFERGPDFQRQGGRSSLVGILARRLRSSRSALAFVVLTSLALVVPGIAIAGFSKIFVDEILVDEKENWLVPLVIGIVVAAMLRGAFTWLQQRYLLRLETKLALTMASRFLWRLIHLPASFFAQRHAGDLSDRMAANDRIAMLLSGQLATNVMNLGMVVFYGLAIAVYDWMMSAVGFTLAAANLVLLKVLSRRRVDINRALMADGGKLVAATVGSIRSSESLKTSGMENDAFRTWAGYQAKMLDSQRVIGLTNVLLTASPVLTGALTTAAILGIGGMRVMEGALSIGSIVAIQSLMLSFITPIGALVDLGGQLQRVRGDIARLDDIEANPMPAPPLPESDWRGAPVLDGQLTLTDVTYGYSPLDPPLLDGISLTVAPGARVALVGGSGSGKSTIGRIAAGLLEPWSGTVAVDGHPLELIPRHVHAGSVAYVDQDIFLFDGTVRDNLTLWDDDVPTQDLTRALGDAEIRDDVMGRSGQLDCHVEEGGTNFSGGQRQRLEIARALTQDPRILILDEATAALDTVTEKAIDDNLRRRGCTCLIIAHRLSTIRDCDEIIVLSRGKIVERGTHDALIAADGAYAALIADEG